MKNAFYKASSYSPPCGANNKYNNEKIYKVHEGKFWYCQVKPFNKHMYESCIFNFKTTKPPL